MAKITETPLTKNEESLKELKSLVLKNSPLKPNIIRDAGCIIRFVVIKPRIAWSVGQELLPEDFGETADLDYANQHVPRSSLVVLAVLFAWGQIIKKALVADY